MHWILTRINHQTGGWDKYDNPTTVSQNIGMELNPFIYPYLVIEMKKLGIDLDFPPTKLKYV